MLFGNQRDNNIISSFLWRGFVSYFFLAFHSDELDTICCFSDFSTHTTHTEKSNNRKKQIKLVKAFCSLSFFFVKLFKNEDVCGFVAEKRHQETIEGQAIWARAIKYNRSCSGDFITGLLPFPLPSSSDTSRHQLGFSSTFLHRCDHKLCRQKSLSCCWVEKATRH